MKFSIKYKLQVFYTNILCSFFFVKNLTFTKKLILKSFLYTDNIIIRSNEAELNWKIKGCHKISITGLGILPGNVSGIKLLLNNKINPIEIKFYGIGGQKEIKKIEIKTSSPSVLNTFIPIANISNLSSIPLAKEDLKKKLINSFNYEEPKQVKLQNPRIVIQSLKINLESFIKTNYPIKS